MSAEDTAAIRQAQVIVATIHSGGSQSFEALDNCTCSFRGRAGTVAIMAYGTTTRRGVTRGTFLITSGGAVNGELANRAGWGTFTSAGQPAGTLRLVEHLTLAGNGGKASAGDRAMRPFGELSGLNRDPASGQ